MFFGSALRVKTRQGKRAAELEWWEKRAQGEVVERIGCSLEQTSLNGSRTNKGMLGKSEWADVR